LSTAFTVNDDDDDDDDDDNNNNLLNLTKAVITTTIRLRIDCDSTAVRFNWTAIRPRYGPFDDIRYDPLG